MAETIESIPVPRPRPTAAGQQGLCLDKGYDYKDPRALTVALGFTLHLRSRGEEAKELKRKPGVRARRWVVERTHGWMNRFRRILIRWEIREDTYVATLHLTCGIIAWRALGLLKEVLSLLNFPGGQLPLCRRPILPIVAVGASSGNKFFIGPLSDTFRRNAMLRR